MYIVEAKQHLPQHLLHFQQMMQVGSSEVTTGVALTPVNQRIHIQAQVSFPHWKLEVWFTSRAHFVVGHIRRELGREYQGTFSLRD